MTATVELVLGAGGIKGFAHIGTLKALASNSVRVGVVTGVSVGSIIATLHKNGCSPEEIAVLFLKRLRSRFAQANWMPDLSGKDVVSLATGFYPDLVEPMRAMVKDLGLAPHDELRILAYDAQNRRPVVFQGKDYDLGMAMAASCSLPGVFRPVRYRDGLLVDGGLYHRNPCDFCKGPAIISKLGFAKELPREVLPPWEFWWHMQEMLGLTRFERHDVDCSKYTVIEHESPHVSALGFGHSEATCLRLVDQGFDRTVEVLGFTNAGKKSGCC